MNQKKPFSKDILLLDNVEAVVDNICKKMQEDVQVILQRKGCVVGMSGGIDSSVCTALATRAFGPDKVVGIMIPEKDSSSDSEELAMILSKKLGIQAIKEIITPALEGYHCYERRDKAVRKVFPEYDPSTHKMKIGIRQSGLFTSLPPIFTVTIVDNEGKQKEQLLPADEYLQIVAASNLKQRTRMSILYFHAEARHYVVVGTPNRQEQDQGFFVKYGDGGADIMPISNLYKTQVYQIAKYLGVPQAIIERTPTTDTYSAYQTQEEFFYQLPVEQMDLYWFGFENDYSPAEVARVMGETPERVEALFANFKRKRRTTDYLRLAPIRDYYGPTAYEDNNLITSSSELATSN
ncbi:MAG TPA: NAD(+) synthase [Bacteroidales bacterium]|nr:NAD(+) synthase [Bacteroidales bacterium]